MRKNIIIVAALTIFVVLPIVSLAKFNNATDNGVNDNVANDNHPANGNNSADNNNAANGKKGTGNEANQDVPAQDIIDKMPSGDFITPSASSSKNEKPEEKENLTGEAKVEFKIENAQSVEFYIRRPEALTETYLGKGEKKEDDVWEYPWQTESTPNGSYLLSPKITNEFGEYSGEKVLINVENSVQRKPEEEKKFQNLQAEIQKTEHEIKNKEEEIKTEKETISQEVSKEVEEFVNEIQTVVPEENKEEITPEIEQKKEEFFRETPKSIERILNSKEKEEQEKIKKEVIKKVEEITQPIIEAAKDENKPEAQRLGVETKKQIEGLMDGKLEITAAKKQEVEVKKEELLVKDTDGDGLPDQEEMRLGTDPIMPDSDGDGFLDGSEVALGFDPLNPSPADKIKFQNPDKEKPKKSDFLKVDELEAVVLEEGKKVFKIQGKALPNSFVTIYVYSQPLVMLVKADGNGNWEYILDKPLEEGQHKVYATVTNNKGDLEESSDAYNFTLSGGKVLRIFEQAGGAAVVSPAESLQQSFALLVIAVVVFTLGIAFLVIGIIIRKKPLSYK